MPRIARMWLSLTVMFVAGAAEVRADDIAVLPIGNPTRAYLLGSGEAGQILDCRLAEQGGAAKATVLTLEALAADLATCDVVVVGENHTNMDGHRTQWKILEALAKTGRPFALGMEFFEVTEDAALASYVSGADNLATMLDKTGWYEGGAFNFEYYRPMVETAKSHGAPIYGLNIPRDWVRTVSRQGEAALTPEQKAYVGELGDVDPRHKYVINQMMGGIGAAMPEMFDGMYRGQTAWDAAMATSIVKAHRAHAAAGKPRTIVVIVGSGHMAHGLGIPPRLAAMEPSLKVRTIAPVHGTTPPEDARVHPGLEKKETAVFSRGLADMVYILPDDGGWEEFPTVGVRFTAPKPSGAEGSAATTGLVIAGVTPGGIAERAGLRKDDTVLSIGDTTPTTVRQAGSTIADLRWNQRVDWKVRRAGAEGEVTVPMIVVPGSDAEGDWLQSKPASALLDSFDPASDRSYLDAKDTKRETLHARLVSFRNKPVRIDVMRGTRLEECWQLDAHGRATTGILSAPARDGAVRIEIERDEAGKATTTKRIGADGKTIGGAPVDANK